MNDIVYIAKRGKRIAWAGQDMGDDTGPEDLLPDLRAEIYILAEDKEGGYIYSAGRLTYDRRLSKRDLYRHLLRHGEGHEIGISLKLEEKTAQLHRVNYVEAPTPDGPEFEKFWQENPGEYDFDEFITWLAANDPYFLDGLAVGSAEGAEIAEWLEKLCAIIGQKTMYAAWLIIPGATVKHNGTDAETMIEAYAGDPDFPRLVEELEAALQRTTPQEIITGITEGAGAVTLARWRVNAQ